MAREKKNDAVSTEAAAEKAEAPKLVCAAASWRETVEMPGEEYPVPTRQVIAWAFELPTGAIVCTADVAVDPTKGAFTPNRGTLRAAYALITGEVGTEAWDAKTSDAHDSGMTSLAKLAVAIKAKYGMAPEVTIMLDREGTAETVLRTNRVNQDLGGRIRSRLKTIAPDTRLRKGDSRYSPLTALAQQSAIAVLDGDASTGEVRLTLDEYAAFKATLDQRTGTVADANAYADVV